MQSEDLVNKGKSLKMKLSATLMRDDRYQTIISPQFLINGLVLFQVKLESILDIYKYMNSFVFVRFTKQWPDDDLTYSVTFTSDSLKIVDQRYTCDNTWHSLQCEKLREFYIVFDVSVRVEVLPSVTSFANLHEDIDLTDFELRGTDGAVRVHRAVLAATSPVLRTMLGGEWRETAEGRVDVSGTTSATLQHFKNYIYLHILPETDLEQLLLLSSYYMMPDLEQKCVDKLVQNMNASNVMDMIEFAWNHKLMRLVCAIFYSIKSDGIRIEEIKQHLLAADNANESNTTQN